MSRAPSFLRTEGGVASRPRGEWIAAIALVLLLAVQLVVQQRDVLAASPTWRPLLASACDIVGCTLPPWRQPAAFTMLSREVIAVPDRPGVLRVQASFRNDARWAQAWPALVLTLTNADSRVLGSRRFLPADYMPVNNAGASARGDTLAPGQATQIAFDIAEPAPDVVGFDFRFD